MTPARFTAKRPARGHKAQVYDTSHHCWIENTASDFFHEAAAIAEWMNRNFRT